MNDPNKVINVNLSSLLSLKAELLRKQSEVSRAKATRVAVDDFTPNKLGSIKKKDAEQKNSTKEKLEPSMVVENTALLEKSQKTLVAKSKFYERMTRTGGQLNSDDNCLVLFNRKKQENDEQPLPPPSSSKKAYEASSSDSSYSDSETEDEEWVEYTDCLGRTRKCLRKDLESVKKRDKDLAASMPERLDQSKPNWMIDVQGSTEEQDDILIGPQPTESIFSEGCSVMSKHDEMRANWEKTHEENVQKHDIHYQDVFFDEARQHGVGYYAFSTDEAERAKQQSELDETRKQTMAEQQHRDTLRVQREQIIAERVWAAKNRQRARLGLPPLEKSVPTELPNADSDNKVETKTERKERKRLEKLKRKQEKLQTQQELERKQHVRPWDKEKEGVDVPATTTLLPEQAQTNEEEWVYKPERLPMSQQEWNEHKRAERNPEFAPVAAAKFAMPQPLKRTNFSSSSHAVTPSVDFVSFQSSKSNKQFQRRNYEIGSQSATESASSYSRGAAIPPPANLDADAYLPAHAKKSKSSNELERSIEAGLRFLRNNSDKDSMSLKSSWTAKADY